MQGSGAILYVTAAALMLTACGKSAPAPAPPPAAAVPAGPALPMPTRAAGLWKQTISNRGNNQIVRICLDQATDGKLALWSQGMGMEKCSRSEARRGVDGAVTFDSECDMGPGGVITSTGKAVGDFSSHYTVTIEGTVSGAMAKHLNGSSTTTIDAVREGACPTGWKGGDMEMPGVGKINIDRLKKQADQLRGLSGRLSFRP